MNSDSSSECGLFLFKDEGETCFDCTDSRSVWRILIAADDTGVHEATKLALRDIDVLGKKIEFYDAYNSVMTLRVLKDIPDIAVILLDVAMGHSTAGLDLISVIRSDLNMTDLRIILSSSEFSEISEMDVIRDYDVDDYKLKSELTPSQLLLLIISSVRSYKQICNIQNRKRGLALILRASSKLMAREGIEDFSHGVIVYCAALFRST